NLTGNRSTTNNKKHKEHDMRTTQLAFAAAACLLTCTPALATGFDLAASPSVTASERTTAAVFASLFGERPDDNRIHLEPISTRTDALSSRFEFMTSAGWQNDRFVVMLRHISNAHLIGGGKNLGETMLLAGVKFQK